MFTMPDPLTEDDMAVIVSHLSVRRPLHWRLAWKLVQEVRRLRGSSASAHHGLANLPHAEQRDDRPIRRSPLNRRQERALNRGR